MFIFIATTVKYMAAWWAANQFIQCDMLEIVSMCNVLTFILGHADYYGSLKFLTRVP